MTALVAQKQTKAYDQAVGILKDLRDLAEHRHQADTFQAGVRELQQRHRSLSGLRYRLEQAGLLLEES